MKVDAGEDPNHTFPLRDVESQFTVEVRHGGDRDSLGSLSYGQLLREAYPAAIYYYTTRPFRVYKVNVREREVLVRTERAYTTKPQKLPTLVFPNLTDESVRHASTFESIRLIESDLQVRESVCGVKERRGSNEFSYSYPLDFAKASINFPLPLFTRNYFTTGVLVTHPAFDGPGVSIETVGTLLFEAFLMELPFDRTDINVAWDKHRVSALGVTEGERFVAIYDQTYGSLRLTSRLTEPALFLAVCSRATDLAQDYESDGGPPNEETVAALDELARQARVEPRLQGATGVGSLATSDDGTAQRVVMPGSAGLNTLRDNEEFEVAAVVYTPRGLAYRGRRMSNLKDDVVDVLPAAALVEIPGVSRMGLYDLDTGCLTDISS